MKKALLLGVIALLLGVSSETFAQKHSDRQRVQRGVRSGQITRNEARTIREQQRENRTERRVYRSDGNVTRAERREIRRDERQSDRRIRRARHNNDGVSAYWRNHHRGNGYYRRGAGSTTHPVFGSNSRRHRRRN